MKNVSTLSIDVSLTLDEPIDATTWNGVPCKVEVVNGTVYGGGREPYYRRTRGRKVKKDGSMYADTTSLAFHWAPPGWAQQAIGEAARRAARQFLGESQ